MYIKKTILGFCATLMLSVLAAVSAVNANGQINIDQLSPASSYDAGVIQSGGLDSALWQGISAVDAITLIKNIDTSAVGSARTLNRAALLSGGVPPQAADGFERDAYLAARLSAVLALGNLSDFDALANQSDVNRANHVYIKIFLERALLGTDTQGACSITDNVIVERKSPYWAKLRAFCHVMRGEIPAAELTADLLSRSGHEDKTFFALLGKLTGTRPEVKLPSLDTPLHIAMAREIMKTGKLNVKKIPLTLSATVALDINQAPADKLEALLASAHLLDAQQISSILSSFTDTPIEPAEILAQETWSDITWGGAYMALKTDANMDSRAALVGALLGQAEKHNMLMSFALALEVETRAVPALNIVKFNADIFARSAVYRGDTEALRRLYQALDIDDPLRMRIALAADALNNGFLFGELGVDIETRLGGDGKIKARAVRDSYIAVAMGANLSRPAEIKLKNAKLAGRSLNSGEMLAFTAAARRGSKAELALRAAHLIDGDQLRANDLAELLATLNSAGMYEQAGTLAALDILEMK